MLEIRTSAREEAGEIVLSNSDFTDKFKKHPGEPTQVPAGVGRSEARGQHPSPWMPNSALLPEPPTDFLADFPAPQS